MQRIDPSRLPTGRALLANLYDADGRLLWPRGATLEAIDLKLSTDRTRNGVYADGPLESPGALDPSCDPATADAGADPTDRHEVSVDHLRPGSTLAQSIYDTRDVLLLTAGTVVTPKFLVNLRERGIRSIRVANPRETGPLPPRLAARHAKAAAPASIAITPQTTARMERVIRGARNAALPRPAATPRPACLDHAQISELVEAGRAYLHRSHDTVVQLAASARQGQPPRTEEAKGVVTRFAQLIARNSSAALLLLDQHPDDDDYLIQHGLNVSLLSMTIAESLGFGPADVEAVGLGGLIQDLGMLHVPDEIRLATRKLEEAEWAEVRKHPLMTLQLIEHMSRLGDTARIVAYQAHERCDGSGYPSQRTRTDIHPLARIVAVADTYAALTAARPHRPGHAPYDAAVVLLQEANAGRLDADAVRAFMHAVSLFPVGSAVRLSDGTAARVIATNGRRMTEPIVAPLDQPTARINLAHRPGLKITGACDAAA